MGNKGATMKCPNCGQIYKIKKDRYYKASMVHDNNLCPYNFDISHHSFKLVRAKIAEYWAEKFPWKTKERKVP
jgi:uncharacterized C2H2 Zn-finger protein